MQKEITVGAQLLNLMLPSQIALCLGLTELYCKQLFCQNVFWSSFALKAKSGFLR